MNVFVGETATEQDLGDHESEDLSKNNQCEDSDILEKALKEARRLGSREDPIKQDPSQPKGIILDMFMSISNSDVQIRSQQKGEPEFSQDQKLAMLLELYESKPLIFLERFRKVLSEEHLECFNHLSGNYTADYYCKEICKASHKRVDHTLIRNKRYAALQKLITAGEYFSDEQMRERDPLMYEHYVGQYQSEEEIMSRNSKDMSEATSLSTVLLNSCQEQALQCRLEAQRELEESCMEEEEDEDDEAPPAGHFLTVLTTKKSRKLSGEIKKAESEIESDEECSVNSEERALMREEFISRMHQRFLDGKDRDFDYSQVDDDPELDNLDIVNQDEEERYFDDEDPKEAEAENSQTEDDQQTMDVKE